MKAKAMARLGLRLAGLTVLALPMLAGAACSIYRNDRCYVDDTRYGTMRQLFMQTGSRDMVVREMDRLQWARCEKNEVLYRITKEFEVPSE